MAQTTATGGSTKTTTGKPNSTTSASANSAPASTAPAEVPVKGLVIGKPVAGRTLPPVSGKGRRPNPVPADLREAAEASLAAGGVGVPVMGTQREIDKLKRDLKKYRLAQENGGRIIQIDYRSDPENKPSTDKPGKFEFFVTLVRGPEKPV